MRGATHADYPERLIPAIPNDMLLTLILNCNLAIAARVTPDGWEYVEMEFYLPAVEESIYLRWTP
jgi:hypothetical protein